MTDEHKESCDCGCDCGCHDGKEAEIYPPYFVVGIAGFILLAIGMLASGIVSASVAMHDNNPVWDLSMVETAFMIEEAVAVCLLLVSAYGFLTGLHNESIFLTIFSVYMLVMSLCYRNMSDDAYILLYVLMAVMLLIPTVMFVLNREVILAVAGFAAIIGMILCNYVSPYYVYYAVPVIISGVLLAYVALANLVYYETEEQLLPLI